jgi:multidrug efflux pump subunit AcrA (membrane-fusion protein)
VDKGPGVVRVAILDRDPCAVPETGVQVAFLVRRISPKENKPMLAIERSALNPCRGGYSVFVASHGRVTERVVRLGRQFKDDVEVLGGVALGEALVASPPDGMKNGSRITVRKD